jgi:hypothetical protein
MVPLVLDDALMGTLGLYSLDAGRYTSEHQQVAELVSGHLAWMVNALSFSDDTSTRAVPKERSVSFG